MSANRTVCLVVHEEGSRSRTGKAMVPKSGMLSVIVNAVLEGILSAWLRGYNVFLPP